MKGLSSIFLLFLLISVQLSESEKVKKKSKVSKKKTGLTGFIVGRINPNPAFELSRLNGFYKPDEASELCEKTLECSGFTFLGSKGASQKFRIKFFRYVSSKDFEDAKKGGNWIYTSYRVKRNFVAIFHQKLKVKSTNENVERKTVSNYEELILKNFDLKMIQNFKWKSAFAALSIPFFGDQSKASMAFSCLYFLLILGSSENVSFIMAFFFLSPKKYLVQPCLKPSSTYKKL